MATPTSTNSASFTNSVTVPTTGLTPGQTGWDGSLCVISGFNSTTSSAQGYEQALTLLSFSDNTNTVPTGQTKTLMLDQLVPGGTTPLLGYNLLIAQPNNLFPVAAVGELANILSGVFPPMTIPGATPADSSSGLNAFVFVQNLQAFPGSNLAQQFTTALNTASSASSSAGLDSAMDAYFAQTASFKDVTFNAYLAAQSYVTAFAFAWANFAASYTYYVYTTGLASGSSGSGGTVSELGTITFTQSASSGIPSLTDPTGGYTITYQPTSGASETLTFANGQVISTGGGPVPAIALQGVFMNMSNATGNQSDFGSIIPSLVGTVYGKQAMATAYQQDLSNPNQPSGLQKFLNSSGWQLTMGIMNIAMGLKAIGEMVGWVYGKLTGTGEGSNKPQDPPSQQQQQQQEQQNVEQEQANLQNANPDAQVPNGQQLPQQQQDIQQQVVNNNNGEQQQQLEEEQQEEANQIEDQLELENNAQVQNEAGELHQEAQDVNNINPDDPNAAQQLQNAQGENQQLQGQIEDENAVIEQQVNQQEAQQLENAAQEEQQEQQEEEEEQEEEQQEEQQEEEGNDGGEEDEMDDFAAVKE